MVGKAGSSRARLKSGWIASAAAVALIIAVGATDASAADERTRGTVTGALIGGGIGLILGGDARAGLAGALLGGTVGNLHGMEKKRRRKGKYYQVPLR